MKEDTLMKKFRIVCDACEKGKKRHETTLYVNWGKKYYMIHCFTCSTTEAFDELGVPISTEDEAEKKL